jgi:ATP-binding cassette, subfamily F, member 3
MVGFSNVSKQYGSKLLYKDASFIIRPADKIGLVGPNGAGKSTLFQILMGKEDPDSGEVVIPGKTVMAMFSQDVGQMRGRTVLEEVKAGSAALEKVSQKLIECEKKLENSDKLSEDEMEKCLLEYGEAQTEFEKRGGYDLDHRAAEVLTGLGIQPEFHSHAVEHFSGGWKMRIELAKILTMQPDVLLMDEPTNHLDIESIIWLEQWLINFKGGLLMTTHDREFMNRVCKRIVEVANKTVTVFSGNYDFYLKEKEIRKEQLVASFGRQQDMLAKEEEFIARFAARASHAAQVNSRVKKLEKIDRIEIPPEEKLVSFEFKAPPRSGEDVVVFENAVKEWITQEKKVKPVFSGVNGVVRRLSKTALVGVNGAGKSTLLKCITGETTVTNGLVKIGASVNLGYFSQHAMDILNPNKTIFQTIQDIIPNASIGTIKTLLGAFLFSGDDSEKKISVLSGGEKSRVVLASILAQPVNFLVLDEPTNHLDIRSREILLESLKKFEGTILIVSHDRFFLKELVNQVFEVDHGRLNVYQGDFDYYLEKSAFLKQF